VEICPLPKMSSDASIPMQFFGSEQYTLDEKGRVTVPFDWRRSDGTPDVFYLVPNSKGECLLVMRPDRYAKFGTDARALPGMDEAKHRMFMRNFFAKCSKTVADKQGRIAIPVEDCTKYGLDLRGKVTLHGTGDLFEIWNPAKLEAKEQAESADYEKIAGAMGL